MDYIADPAELSVQKKKFPTKKFLLISIGTVITFVVLVIIFTVIFPQNIIVIQTKTNYSKTKTPELYVVPTDRTVKSTLIVKNPLEYSFEKFTIKVPWKNLKEKFATGSANQKFTALSFENKKGLIYGFQPFSREEIFLNPTAEEKEIFNKLFGQTSTGSTYKFYKMVYDTSPDQISFFMDRKQSVVKPILLVYKTVLFPISTSTIYNFSVNSIRGFQFGDPNIDKGVLVQFFDTSDNVYELMIREANQSEIDFIIHSIKTQ